MSRFALIKKALIAISVTGIICLCSGSCLADEVSSNELLNNSRDHDGRSVVYQGEVVGDMLVRGDHAWLSVNDGSNAIGVWVRSDLLETIQNVGGYTAKGDTIAVTGVFHRSCRLHGGDLDIHAEGLRLIAVGRQIPHIIDKKTLVLVSQLSLFLVLLVVLRAWQKRSRQSSPQR